MRALPVASLAEARGDRPVRRCRSSSAVSRTRAMMSSIGSAAAILARGRTAARSRVTKETSASGSAPGVSSAATRCRGHAVSSFCRLNGGTLAESSEVVSERFDGDAHERAHAHDFAVADPGGGARCG